MKLIKWSEEINFWDLQNQSISVLIDACHGCAWSSPYHFLQKFLACCETCFSFFYIFFLIVTVITLISLIRRPHLTQILTIIFEKYSKFFKNRSAWYGDNLAVTFTSRFFEFRWVLRQSQGCPVCHVSTLHPVELVIDINQDDLADINVGLSFIVLCILGHEAPSL